MFSKKTKIVATLGPSTSSRETIYQMMKSGVNVFRINFSHAQYQTAKQQVKIIREINEKECWNVAILADLQGPKLRIGNVQEGKKIHKGDHIKFTNQEDANGNDQIYMSYTNFSNDVCVGELIMIDDGKLLLRVKSTNQKDMVMAEVIQGGELKSRKGVNLPNTKISLPALTEKDKKDALFAIDLQVDWIALSFVRAKEDLQEIKQFIKEHSKYDIPVISKIEKPEAIKRIDQIIEHSDGLMVARGDLGVEMPREKLPLIQKMLVRKAKTARKPIIIATQLLESMIELLTPTRAEVNDVANSVIDGADALMLSGETSVGKNPVEVVQMMTTIIKDVELHEGIEIPDHKPDIKEKNRYITNVICYDSAQIAKQINAKAIITLTHSGYTAFQLSSHRPFCHTLVFTDNIKILRILNLLWGVYAFYYDQWLSTDKTIQIINEMAKGVGIIESGDFVINLSSMPVEEKGKVNTIRITEIE